MNDKYKLLRESLHELQREASAKGGHNPRSQMILDLLAERDALQAECDRLTRYYKNGIDCFANPCERHSGERTPPFPEFFERYGGQCLICVVDENEKLRKDAERYRWLADACVSDWLGEEGPVLVHAKPWNANWRAELDAAIDAAMQGVNQEPSHDSQ